MKLRNSNHHTKSRVQSAAQSRVGMVALYLSSALLTNACGKSEDKAPGENLTAAEATVDNDEASLTSRIEQTNIPVTLDAPPGQLLVVDAFVGLQVGYVNPPTVGSNIVQANKVLVNGLTTYIGYNFAGEPYSGAIDAMDLQNLATLTLKSSLKFTDTDINGTLAITKTTALTDARSVGFTPAGLPMVLSGQPGRVNTMTAAGDISSTFALGGAATVQSKSNLYVGSKWSVATLSEGGFKIFCNSDGTVIATVPQVTISGTPAAKTVTNAVTSANGVIYTANGEAGIYVYYVRSSGSSTCGSGSVTPMGSMNIGGSTLSANGVFANGLNLFVADGLGGLRVMTTVTTVNVLSPLTDRL
ncbi:MAG: hypothetical protein EOP07_24860 [Proteobacteria bacterium]|nr:MAG: hypothetical protein EOP07_24860 [Pseudomonadota bacterium]